MSDSPPGREAKSVFFLAPAEVRTARVQDAALFVRTHKWNAKVEELVTRLIAVASNFDLYVLYDVSRSACPVAEIGRAGVPADRLIQISERMSAALGLYRECGVLYHRCGDVALGTAMRQAPEYRFYGMIDWDVYFRPGRETAVATLFAKLLAEPRPADFVGLLLKHLPRGEWYKAGRKMFPDQVCYYSYFPFVVLSRPLLALAHVQRQVHQTFRPAPEDFVNCELFVPSLAVAAGMVARDLLQYLPGAYNGLMLMQGGPDGLGLPLEAVHLVTDDVAMIHPVFTAEDFVASAREKFLVRNGPQVERLRTHLARPEWGFVPRELTAELRAAVGLP